MIAVCMKMEGAHESFAPVRSTQWISGSSLSLLHVTEFKPEHLTSTRDKNTYSRRLHYKSKEQDGGPGQDSPFWTLETGGCIKSLKGPRASFRAELTSEEEQVMHSTNVGYRAITWAHVFPSTAGRMQKETLCLICKHQLQRKKKHFDISAGKT